MPMEQQIKKQLLSSLSNDEIEKLIEKFGKQPKIDKKCCAWQPF
jgi:hypothetical protein